ncbi:MAG: hypothetical protein U5K54_00155 [Cytophagales bacterium]|nr:hypothetical protein [Cytophagales bacterium]
MQWIREKILTWQFKFIAPITIILIVISVASCDIVGPHKKFKIARVKSDYFYSYVTGHLKPLLEKRGYHIEVFEAINAFEANELVAKGTADLTFINNHSFSISDNIKFNTSDLRTVVPLATTVALYFYQGYFT